MTTWEIGLDRELPETATLTVTFDPVACTPVVLVAPAVNQATCTAGAVTSADGRVGERRRGSSTASIRPILVIGHRGYPVTVTAKLADGFGVGSAAAVGGGHPTTATLAVDLVGTTCDEVTPVPPTNHAAQCVDGALTPPTLTLAETDGISYSVDEDPPYAPGQTVVVTATLDEQGDGWPDQLPTGWTATSDTTATLTHTFDDVTCTAVLPVDPTVVEGSCANGVATAASVQLEATPGLVYSVDPPGPYDPAAETDVVVTATVLNGYAWEGSAAAPAGFAGRGAVDTGPQGAPPPVELPAGWTWVSPTEATFAITLPQAPACPEVAPTTTTLRLRARNRRPRRHRPRDCGCGRGIGDRGGTHHGPTTTAAAAGEESATAAAPTPGPTTSVPGPIPETGASGLPGQLLVALLAVSSGLVLIMVGRRRHGVG